MNGFNVLEVECVEEMFWSLEFKIDVVGIVVLFLCDGDFFVIDG